MALNRDEMIDFMAMLQAAVEKYSPVLTSLLHTSMLSLKTPYFMDSCQDR